MKSDSQYTENETVRHERIVFTKLQWAEYDPSSKQLP